MLVFRFQILVVVSSYNYFLLFVNLLVCVCLILFPSLFFTLF